jgi:hypothetical protein
VWKTPSRTPNRDAARMSINPDDLLHLGVAEPGRKQPSPSRRSGSRAHAKHSGGHRRDPLLDRARHWLPGRFKREVDWLSSRFLPWLGCQTARGTHAAQAFWSALEPEERERLWKILEKFRVERRVELGTLDQREVGQIAAFVYGGLVAARQAWRTDPNEKAK